MPYTPIIITIKGCILALLFCSFTTIYNIRFLHKETNFCASNIQKDSVYDLKFFKKKAKASYYSNKFNGRKTSNGSIFDNQKYTAAHRNLPFGTKLKITNLNNSKSVIVTVTDRGCFSKNHEIDLTQAAFLQIEQSKKKGFIMVSIEIIKNQKN